MFKDEIKFGVISIMSDDDAINVKAMEIRTNNAY